MCWCNISSLENPFLSYCCTQTFASPNPAELQQLQASSGAQGLPGHGHTGSQLRLLVGTMAAHRQLLPAQGLLLCVLALHFCTQGPLAIAGRKVVNMSIATNHASVAATKASVATKQALVASANTSVAASSQPSVATNQTSVATTRALMATSKQASMATTQASVASTSAFVATSKQALVATNQTPVATTRASMATSKQALVATSQASVASTSASMATSKQALVATSQASVASTSASMATSKQASMTTTQASVATTRASMAATNQTSVATTRASMATTNQASVATNQTSVATTRALMAISKQALVATSQASVASTSASMATSKQASMVTSQASVATTRASMATSKQASVATNHTSVTTTTTTSVATSQASVAANASVNHTEQTPLSCQSFQCSGERCYQDETHSNMTTTCHNETFCELYRSSSTKYTARCSRVCSAELCRTNGSMTLQQCTMECCNTSLCLQLNASSYGDLPPTTVPPTTTTTTTTTTPWLPPRNGKICAAFSCHGDGCFKGKKSTARCFVGHDFCEMKKMGFNYVAGCSKACKAAKPVCAQEVKAACFQECCPATPKGSCLKLDGKVHVNGAGQVAVSPLLQLLACGAALLLSHRASTPLHGCSLLHIIPRSCSIAPLCCRDGGCWKERLQV